MNHLAGQYGWLDSPQVRCSSKNISSYTHQRLSLQAYVSLKNEADKVVVYERAGLLFIFNFHPTKSFTDYRVGVEEPGEYKIVLSSDEGRFGGFNNIMLDSQFFTTPLEWNGRKNFLQVCCYSKLFRSRVPEIRFPRFIFRPELVLCLLSKARQKYGILGSTDICLFDMDLPVT